MKLQPAMIFGSHMVLQRQQPVAVWGRGAEGDRVTVTLGSDSAAAQVRAGQWQVSLPAREAETGLTRPLAALSRGTQDQAWLALRLAMTRLLLPEGTPIVLDDALLTFDETRTRAALAVLALEGRQSLVFTCRSLAGPEA